MRKINIYKLGRRHLTVCTSTWIVWWFIAYCVSNGRRTVRRSTTPAKARWRWEHWYPSQSYKQRDTEDGDPTASLQHFALPINSAAQSLSSCSVPFSFSKSRMVLVFPKKNWNVVRNYNRLAIISNLISNLLVRLAGWGWMDECSL